ncbi:MAG: methyltransferase domain-containing protein [Gammaproteobacteria bacterium]|nr:methyltransferase domain-containing protein [Gammaproteobacteria bacterium]
MNKLKMKIRRHFDKADKTYDDYCSVQNDACTRSLEMLRPYAAPFEVIADFACGTGESTLKLIETIHHQRCYAVDFSANLLQVAMKKLPESVNCLLSDFDIGLFESSYLDLVFCNMGLQWSADFEITLTLFRRYLKPKGYLVFSMPVYGNFPEIKNEFKYPLLEHEQVIQFLKSNDFKVLECCVYQRIELFKSSREALSSLQKVGSSISVVDKGLKRIKEQEFFVEQIGALPILTYRIAIYICQR